MNLKIWSIVLPIIFIVCVSMISIITRVIDFIKYKPCNGEKYKKSIVNIGLIGGFVSGLFVIFAELLAIFLYNKVDIDIYSASYGTKGLLITLSIVLGIIVFIFLLVSITNEFDTDIDNEGILIVITIVCMAFSIIPVLACRSICVDNKLKELPYEVVSDNVIYIYPLDGCQNGNYVNIKSNSIDFLTKKDNGSLEPRNFGYSSDFFDIFEDDDEVPRIIITTKGRILKDKKDKILREEYYDSYVIYIPTGKYSGDIY